MDTFEWLEHWYLAQCNGDWEHEYGVKIDTTDNPGWEVFIELEGTPVSGVTMQPYVRKLTDDDWVRCEVKGNVFVGYGDAKKLRFILNTFRTWVERR